MKRTLILSVFFMNISSIVLAQEKQNRHEETEIYSPVPPKVTPGAAFRDAPSDAIILFDGKNLDQWVNSKDSSAASWILSDHAMTVNKTTGDIQTKRVFSDYQLHIEYRIPANISGSDQARGNSGIFLASLPWGAGGYELQVLDNYDNATYVNGQAASIYKQSPPLVNPNRKPGEWQTYDVTLVGRLVTLAVNGKTVICNQIIPGITGGALDSHEGEPGPIMIQGDHGPIDFRNILITPAK